MKTYHFTNRDGNHLAVVIQIKAISLVFALIKLKNLLPHHAHEWSAIEDS